VRAAGFVKTLAACLALATLVLPGAASSASREDKGAPAGDFDLYILALSWSPGFCASGGSGRDRDQCRIGSDLGFVVHGLWPQSERSYPTYCQPTGRSPLRSDLDQIRSVMPSPGLARYEWAKHGTCSGLPPARYFASMAEAYSQIQIPEAFRAPASDVEASALDIERAFADANRGLRPDMTAIGCGRGPGGGPVLQEIRICLTRDLKGFRQCPAEVERDGCRARSIIVPQLR
jgi:ribonuclease T2